MLPLISITAVTACRAAPVQKLHWKAANKKPLSAITEMIDELDFAAAMSEDTNNSRTITEPLTQSDKKRLRSLKSTHVTVSNNADETVFADPNLFSHLEGVCLDSQRHNEEYLKDLASNYPYTKLLTVTQIRPLSDNALRALSGLHQLEYLQLDCPNATPTLVPYLLPTKLERLQIADAWPLPEMPQLKTLDINYCRLEKGFIDKLRAPKLEHLKLNRVDVVKGALTNVGNLTGLVEVNIYNSKIDSAEVASLKPLPYASVSIAAFPEYYASFKSRADQFYKKHQMDKAIGHYREVAFSQPTANTYLQLARCYLAIGEPLVASKYCRFAYCIDPANRDIHAVREQIEQQLKNDHRVK